LDIFIYIPIGLKNATPAQILQLILERKWSLSEQDKDMIVMWHKFVYTTNEGKEKELHSSMVLKGKSTLETAMAMTVGLPVGISTKLLLEGKINEPGVHIPIKKDIYTLILKELEENGIQFVEREIS
ncbi:MAG: saccharopine dehydrogenase, partial [Flavobacteriales bacterium]|nr:saccharopine dehydrogenase [Flavobacteriales bacterium]